MALKDWAPTPLIQSLSVLDGCDVTVSCLLITVGNIFKIKGLSVSAVTVCFFFVFLNLYK